MLFAEDKLIVRGHFEDTAAPFREFRLDLELLLNGYGQTVRAGLVVSLHAVFDRDFHEKLLEGEVLERSVWPLESVEN